MGLDMFAVSFPAKPDLPDVDLKLYKKTDDNKYVIADIDDDFWYWRKHWNLHKWMERLYRSKGGKNEDFNCASVRLTLEDLNALEMEILNPDIEGLFSEVPNERIEVDLNFVKKAREAINNGQAVYYDSWW